MEQNNDDLIIRFLENDLDQEEAREFSNQYKDDPEFRQAVNDHTRLFAALRAATNLNEYKTEGTRKIKEDRGIFHFSKAERRLLLKVAAVVVPIAVAGSLYIFTRPEGNIADSIVAKGIELSIKDEDQLGFSTQMGFKTEQIQQEIDNAILVSLDQLTSIEETYFFGVKSLRESRYHEAIFAFRRVIGSGVPSHAEDSEWLLALCYIKVGESAKAKSTLERISVSELHKYQNESLKLLKKLD